MKVKVLSVAGSRISLSMKDVDQTTGRDPTPHLRIKSESESDQERQELARRASSGANAMPLGGKGSDPPTSTVRSALHPQSDGRSNNSSPPVSLAPRGTRS